MSAAPDGHARFGRGAPPGPPRHDAPAGVAAITAVDGGPASLPALDEPTAVLVALAATVTAGDEPTTRDALRAATGRVPGRWVEELILQTYLFAGFPRALNAMRLWRAASGREAPMADEDPVAARDEGGSAAGWRARGEETCAVVYGPFYDKLRVNIAALHPALDAWMVTEGYGKVLGRPGLDLARRELCVVAACVAAQQDRQLHSHLHGALHAGAGREAVAAALEVALASAPWVREDAPRRYRQLWAKVAGKTFHDGE